MHITSSDTSGSWPITDWYNKSWVRGKCERQTMAFQRWRDLPCFHDPHRGLVVDGKQLQTLGTVKLTVPHGE